MPRLPILFCAAAALALGACASQSRPAPAPGQTASALAPDPGASADALFLAGEAALDDGHLDDASDFLARAAAARGEPGYLKDAAFAAALEAGHVDAAAAIAPTGADADAAHRSLGVLTRGVAALAEGRAKAAQAAFAGADPAAPFSSVAALLAPWAAAAAGDMARATAAVGGDDAVAQFTASLDRAMLYERAGQTAQAGAAFARLASGPDAGGLVSIAYGAFLERHGRRRQALALYQAALAHAPTDAELLAARARVQGRGRPPSLPTVREGAAEVLVIAAASMIEEKEADPALAYVHLALRLDPADDEAWVILGDLLASRDVDASRAAYAHVRPGDSQYVGARDKLARSYENAGDHEAALKVARETARAAPASRQAAVTLADLLRTSGDYAQSCAVLTRLIDAPQGPADWRLYYLRASAYQDAGDWPKAQADLEAGLKLSPDQPELLNFLGYAWIDRGERLQQALAMVQRAVAADPQSGAMLDSLGWGYYRLGDYASAVQKLEQAVMLAPADAEVNDHLGDAYWSVGRKVEAGFQWRRVLTLAPDAALRAQVQAKLASPLGAGAPGAKAAGPPASAAPPASAPAETAAK